jgi:hypothetical protein
MRRTIIAFLFVVFPFSLHAQEVPLTRAEGPALPALSQSNVSRAEGFRILWEPLKRSVEEVNGNTFDDVAKDHPQFPLLTFAKARMILNDTATFRPEEPLHLKDALLWLLRSRNVDAPSDIIESTLPQFLAYYPLLERPAASLSENPTISEEELRRLIQKLDTFLREERHTVSFYAEEFAGRGTAFGETFDPSAFTAAHRYLPHNTLVHVTYHSDANCLPSEAPQGGAKEGQQSTVNCPTQSVVVRINDRGPYVDGRDMDLSAAAFEKLAPRSVGVLGNVTFERLGEAPMVTVCKESLAAWPENIAGFTRYQRRLGRTLLTPGIPLRAVRGERLPLSADQSFRILQIIPPRGRAIRYEKWTRRGEEVTIHFVQPGTYVLVLLADSGKRQRFRTEVGNCF